MESRNINTKENFFQDNWLILVAILYLILPIDLIPDRVPLVGTLDDAGMLLIYLLELYGKWRRNDIKKDSPPSDVREGEIVK